MKNYAFIFARGGSKGLPGKNIKPLAGKPLLQYSIDTALASPSIDKVFVSTDDADIAKVAIESGALLIERPDEFATDTSPEWLSWRHAIEWAKENHGQFDGFVSLPATSPLRGVEDVEAAIEKRNKVDRIKSRIKIGFTASTYVQASAATAPKHVIQALHQAFLNQENLEIHYESEGGELSGRQIEPHYLLLNYPIWYVVAFDHMRRAPRTFRCDRISSAVRTETRFSLLPMEAFGPSLADGKLSV